MDPNDTSVPRPGGNDYLGILLGGAPLTDTWTIDPNVEPYNCTLQVCNHSPALMHSSFSSDVVVLFLPILVISLIPDKVILDEIIFLCMVIVSSDIEG